MSELAHEDAPIRDRIDAPRPRWASWKCVMPTKTGLMPLPQPSSILDLIDARSEGRISGAVHGLPRSGRDAGRRHGARKPGGGGRTASHGQDGVCHDPGISIPSTSISPVIFTLGIKSFIRLIHLKKVDFPQPDGPIKAVTLLAGICIEILFNAFFSP